MKRFGWIVPFLLLATQAEAQSAGSAPIISAAAESSHVFRAGPGALIDAYVTTGAAAGYVLIFNLTAAPSNGAVTPQDCVAVPANTTASLATMDQPPEWFTVGITAAFSTTGCFTLTLSNTAFFHGRVR